MPSRILIVDDFAPFRRHLALRLAEKPEFHLAGEAADGLDAVQKAQALQPDLILLDLGLPGINGIQAASRIGQLAPHAKVLFISQEFTLDLVEASLKAGGLGYVHKQHASSDLFPAIEAVLQGRYFVSGVLKAGLGNGSNQKAGIRHEVQFWSDDAVLVDSFSEFAATALAAGKAAIVVANESHRAAVLQRLNSMGLDVDHAIKTGTLIQLDAAQTLAASLTSEVPDPTRFFPFANEIIEAAARAAIKKDLPRVAVCGECSPILFAEGKIEEAVRLEQLWDFLAHRSVFDLLCGYPLTAWQKHNQIFQGHFAVHSAAHSR